MVLQDLLDISKGYDPKKVEIIILDYHSPISRATVMDTDLEPACEDRPNSQRRKLTIKTLWGL